MDSSLFTLLRKVDTPTVCNAIELVQGKRGFDAYTRGTMQCSAPEAGAIVGYARTAQIAAVDPSPDAADIVRARRMEYYRYMSDGPRPAVAVVEDLDYPNAVGAYWGEINTTIHKGFGLSGALTNGVMRDLGDLPDGFPVVAGAIGPSHAFVHVRATDCPVTVFGLEIRPGDLVHSDRHGAVVIPDDIVSGLQVGIQKLLDTEAIILDPARKERFDFETFERAWEAFEKARV